MADRDNGMGTQVVGNNDGTCCYVGADTKAQLASNDDGSWSSRCNCMVVTMASGTYEEANQALQDHRAPSGC